MNTIWHCVANRGGITVWVYETIDEFGTEMILYDILTVPIKPQNINVYCDATNILLRQNSVFK